MWLLVNKPQQICNDTEITYFSMTGYVLFQLNFYIKKVQIVYIYLGGGDI